jgi:hypothetical protein
MRPRADRPLLIAHHFLKTSVVHVGLVVHLAESTVGESNAPSEFARGVVPVQSPQFFPGWLRKGIGPCVYAFCLVKYSQPFNSYQGDRND